MRKSIFEPQTRGHLLDRLARLQRDRPPSFGKMNANQMVVHCTGAIDMFIGRLKVTPRRGPLRNPLLRYLVIHVLPWPKGVPTAVELLPSTNPGEFRGNVAKLREAIETFGARNPEGPFDPHPAFGAIKGHNIGALVARHLDHHFRQFGV
jgi:hypothetical protein